MPCELKHCQGFSTVSLYKFSCTAIALILKHLSEYTRFCTSSTFTSVLWGPWWPLLSSCSTFLWPSFSCLQHSELLSHKPQNCTSVTCILSHLHTALKTKHSFLQQDRNTCLTSATSMQLVSMHWNHNCFNFKHAQTCLCYDAVALLPLSCAIRLFWELHSHTLYVLIINQHSWIRMFYLSTINLLSGDVYLSCWQPINKRSCVYMMYTSKISKWSGHAT